MPRDTNPLVVGSCGECVDHFFRSIDLQVIYNTREVANGCEFRPFQVVNRLGRVQLGGEDLRTFFTLLVMVDPDAPSPSNPTLREYLHWLVTDIPAMQLMRQEVVCYKSPRPSTGIHRFAFILFQQLGRQTVYALGGRQNFNTRDFAELYNLGLHVAAVYYNCQRKTGSGSRRR
ncbi:protein HEADING DATE 3A-like [Impatiens glandulifera]|uniref:protein HEADING DATE 3A-like n=1 Tax=Impatiens glandulifera TaxID=253017 RepID=UPI001FB15D9B|nr:protein HEADING DATE 3A-like [Impatiens glandulifera]